MAAEWEAAEAEDDDDEAPPPLSSKPSQQHSRTGGAAANESTGMRSGFLSVSGKAAGAKAAEAAPSMPHIRASKTKQSCVPESLQLPKEQVESFSSNLASKVSNDEQMLSDVMYNPDLRQAFDDPEVMDAVQRIASDPQTHANELQNNPKLANFYRRMSGVLGERLEQYSQEAESSGKHLSSQQHAKQRSGHSSSSSRSKQGTL